MRPLAHGNRAAPHAGADPIGIGSLLGLATGCLVGIAVGLTLAPQDIAWPVITVAVGLLGGLCAGAAVGVAVDLRRRRWRRPPRHDDVAHSSSPDDARSLGGGMLRR